MIKLYSTDCPNCKILKSKLLNLGVLFDIISDYDLMVSMGFKSVPMIEVNGDFFNFGQSMMKLNKAKDGVILWT